MLALLLGEKAPYVDFGLVRSFLLLLHLLHQETRLTALDGKAAETTDDAPAVEATSSIFRCQVCRTACFCGPRKGVVRRISSARRASYAHGPCARQRNSCGLDGARA